MADAIKTQGAVVLRKSYAAKAEIKEDAEEGVFEALVSVFGNEDSQGDVVEKGAYKATLKAWAEKGRPIPILWSHDFSDPDSILGKYVSAEETDEGLVMKGQLDLSHPKAARVHKLMKEGLVVEFSMSGLVTDYEMIEKDGDDDDEDDAWGFPGLRIKEVDLWEAGPCFKGANAQTELLSVKSANSKKTEILVEKRDVQALNLETLKAGHAALGQIIGLIENGNNAEKNVEEDNSSETDTISAGQEVEKSALSPAVRALLGIHKTEDNKE